MNWTTEEKFKIFRCEQNQNKHSNTTLSLSLSLPLVIRETNLILRLPNTSLWKTYRKQLSKTDKTHNKQGERERERDKQTTHQFWEKTDQTRKKIREGEGGKKSKAKVKDQESPMLR